VYVVLPFLGPFCAFVIYRFPHPLIQTKPDAVILISNLLYVAVRLPSFLPAVTTRFMCVVVAVYVVFLVILYIHFSGGVYQFRRTWRIVSTEREKLVGYCTARWLYGSRDSVLRVSESE
jgi:hypothetical protein